MWGLKKSSVTGCSRTSSILGGSCVGPGVHPHPHPHPPLRCCIITHTMPGMHRAEKGQILQVQRQPCGAALLAAPSSSTASCTLCSAVPLVCRVGCEEKHSRLQPKGVTCKDIGAQRAVGRWAYPLQGEEERSPWEPQVCVQEGCSAPWGDWSVGRHSPAPSVFSGSTLHLQSAELGKVFPPLHIQK